MKITVHADTISRSTVASCSRDRNPFINCARIHLACNFFTISKFGEFPDLKVWVQPTDLLVILSAKGFSNSKRRIASFHSRPLTINLSLAGSYETVGDVRFYAKHM